jgi:hypothetical protein
MSSIADSSVTIQTSAQSVPSTPSWFGEVAAFAQVLRHLGLLTTIQEQVRVARARFGKYETIDFLVVFIGYALSGEPALKAFYERLAPFADLFMALFGRSQLPDRSMLSRFLAALDQESVEALRTCFLADLVAPCLFLQRAGCRTGKATSGGSWMWMALDKLPANARSHASQDFPPPIVG